VPLFFAPHVGGLEGIALRLHLEDQVVTVSLLARKSNDINGVWRAVSHLVEQPVALHASIAMYRDLRSGIQPTETSPARQ
jgi:hypothetical protein